LLIFHLVLPAGFLSEGNVEKMENEKWKMTNDK
jgi:hypothetical protein